MPDPTTELDARYGEPDATPTPWPTAQKELAEAELYWISTVRADGRLHVTPLGGVWHDGALHFCTGEREQKARNIAANPQVALTTGRNSMHGGTDLVVEGAAERVTELTTLRELAAGWEAKYGPEWHFDVVEGAFSSTDGGPALVFRVAPTTAYAFGKGPYSQTRWSFEE